MPTQTERQMLADALHRALLVDIIAEAEIHRGDDGYDSDLENEYGDGTQVQMRHPQTSEDAVPPSTSETILEAVAGLYSQRYLNARDLITAGTSVLLSFSFSFSVCGPFFFLSLAALSALATVSRASMMAPGDEGRCVRSGPM
ncbi:hypothetical protein FIBSPDRAFT_896601 [Athelia psychrophila]|uniref:Uncharacterized protein n=1 Tax=Athelia psychrophila TaxID=1759441 RepID=A0A166D9T2_9AGAM|nr:hypothetical protein FIBSPDRAFT_896601 [Fibularhizoctonia sp. CBS 109695]